MRATVAARTSACVARLMHPINVITATTTETIRTGIHMLEETPLPLLPSPSRRSTSLIGLADTNLGHRTTERTSQRSVRGQNRI